MGSIANIPITNKTSKDDIKVIFDAQDRLATMYCRNHNNGTKDLRKCSYVVKSAMSQGNKNLKYIWNEFELWKYQQFKL